MGFSFTLKERKIHLFSFKIGKVFLVSVVHDLSKAMDDIYDRTSVQEKDYILYKSMNKDSALMYKIVV